MTDSAGEAATPVIGTSRRRPILIGYGCALLAVGGLVWVLWLLIAAPQVNAFSDRPEQCYSTFQLPQLGTTGAAYSSSTTDRQHYDDQAVKNGLSRNDLDEAVRVADDCQRVRSYDQALATIVAIPTVLVAAVAVAIGVTFQLRRPGRAQPRDPEPGWLNRPAGPPSTGP